MRVLALLALLVSSAVAAQPAWRVTPAGPAVSVDALLALGDDQTISGPDGVLLSSAVGVTSLAVTVTARVPVGAGVTVVTDLPVAYMRYAVPNVPSLGVQSRSEDDVVFGNPYVGAEAGAGRGLTLGAGVRLPLSRFDRSGEFQDPAQFGHYGGFTADRERFEAYFPEVLTVSALARYEPVAGPVRLRLQLAPAYLADVSGDDPFGDPDFGKTGLALGYGAQAEVGAGPVALSGGVMGRPVLTGQRFELFSSDATAVVAAVATLGPVRPGVIVRVPLDRDRFAFRSDATVGVSLDVPLR